MNLSRWCATIAFAVLLVADGLSSTTGLVAADGAAADAEPAAVTIETTAGEIVDGRWLGTDGSVVVLSVGSMTKEFTVQQLASLRLAKPADSVTGPSMEVVLGDGTSIVAEGVSMDETVVQIEPRRQAMIRMPIQQVRSIRFRPGTPATDPQWLGLAEKETRSDMMVIRRGNDQLDPFEGAVVGLDAKNLIFSLDGDKIEAPRDRLEGVLFRNPPSSQRTAKVKVVDIYGSTFLADRLEASDQTDSIDIMLPGQVRHRVAIDQIRIVTWASGRVMLASEVAADSEMSPYLKTKLPATLIKDWFGPVSEGEDLIATAGGRIEYRVEKGFQTLAGSVCRDQRVAGGGSVVVRLSADGEMKWEQTLDDSNAKGFRIPIGGASRVRLEVFATDDGDVGDQVRFLKPRLLK
ncbi:MAG: NPCBM/NEW2 domain-containing protein [Planctomycetales bacterium]|nr:NPCBM/NEW2 domain-containing protein [Planctomycetales bacterium]